MLGARANKGLSRMLHAKEMERGTALHLSVLVARQAPAFLMTCCTQNSQKGCPFVLASHALGMACAQRRTGTVHSCLLAMHIPSIIG